MTCRSNRSRPAEYSLALLPNSRSDNELRAQPSRRAAFAIESVHVRAEPARLLAVSHRLPRETAINVYPDMRRLSQYALLAHTNRSSLLGVRRGENRPGPRFRAAPQLQHRQQLPDIDWRATARRRKLTVKDFQVSQSQRIFVMIDCGRIMTSRRPASVCSITRSTPS